MNPQPKLNVYQNRLLTFYREVCAAAPDGVCCAGTRAIADECAFSVGKVTSTCWELCALGYIAINAGQGDQPFAVELVEDAPAQDVNETAHAVSGSEHVVNESAHDMSTTPAASRIHERAQYQAFQEHSVQEQNKSKDKNKDKPILSPEAKKRRKHANEDLHHAVVREWGLDPERMTKTADSLYWRVAAELRGVGLTAEQVPALHSFVKRKAREGDWSKGFSPLALSKYAPEFLKAHEQTKADQQRRADAEREWQAQHPELYPAVAS